MKHYRQGNPEGRFVGSNSEIEVYANSFRYGHNNPREKHGREEARDGEMWFEYGPSTGGLMESVGISFLTPGELIKQVEVDPSFKERELKLSGKTTEDALLLVERINGFHSASHSIAFCSAVEDALGIEVNESTVNSRIVMMEIERIRSHLEVIKRLCEPAGFGVPASQVGYLREKISRIISDVAGHRYFFGANRTGTCDLSIGHRIRELDEVVGEFSRVYEGLLQSKIFLNRLQNNGVVEEPWLIGPAARASGKETDARVDSLSIDYGGNDFRPVCSDEPDTFGRFMVRSGEIFQSLDLIKKTGTGKSSGSPAPDLSGSGKGAARIESPQGDLFYHVNIKDGLIQSVSMLSPSLSNIKAFRDSMKGNIFTDFHFNWESFGVWISEAGVILR